MIQPKYRVLVVPEGNRRPNKAKYGFLFFALIFTIIIVGYSIAFIKIGPADKTQKVAYIALLAVNYGLLVASIGTFLIVFLGFGKCRFIVAVYTYLVLLLVLSMASATIFNWIPDARSISEYLRESLENTGEPSPFIAYIESRANCCGANGLEDYEKSKDIYFPIPPACCKDMGSCMKNPQLATKGCMQNVPGSLKPVYAENNPTLRQHLLAIQLCPLVLPFLCSAFIMLLAYFHCWKMVFPQAVPSVLTFIRRERNSKPNRTNRSINNNNYVSDAAEDLGGAETGDPGYITD